MSPELRAALERARDHKISPEELFEQKVSFVYGQQMDSPNPLEKDAVRQMLIEQQGYPRRTITKDRVEEAARALYAASCANDPVEMFQEPDWGRGGYKTQVFYWRNLALAAAQSFGLAVEGE